MYGVPADLDLSCFYGAEVIQLAIGEHQLQVILQPAGTVVGPLQTIGIEGHWELRDADGRLLDQAQEHGQRDVYRAHRLLGRRVISGAVAAPESFTLTFDNGLALRIFDDSKEYESFSIQPGDIFI